LESLINGDGILEKLYFWKMLFRGLVYMTRRTRWHLGGIWGRLALRLYGVQFGRHLQLGSAPMVQRHRDATIRLGNDVVILNTLAENLAGIAHRTVLCATRPGAELVIGNRVGISGAVLYAWRRIEIGDRVAIGAGAEVYDSDFHPLDPAARDRGDPSQVGVAPVVIESDAWLCARCMVLKGVTIGRAAVVGAGAVVTKDVPAGAIVAGAPARVVGRVPSSAELHKA
jgi:acetyltransferase-like isoleucine patch superfamily enzyme